MILQSTPTTVWLSRGTKYTSILSSVFLVFFRFFSVLASLSERWTRRKQFHSVFLTHVSLTYWGRIFNGCSCNVIARQRRKWLMDDRTTAARSSRRHETTQKCERNIRQQSLRCNTYHDRNLLALFRSENYACMLQYVKHKHSTKMPGVTNWLVYHHKSVENPVFGDESLENPWALSSFVTSDCLSWFSGLHHVLESTWFWSFCVLPIFVCIIMYVYLTSKCIVCRTLRLIEFTIACVTL